MASPDHLSSDVATPATPTDDTTPASTLRRLAPRAIAGVVLAIGVASALAIFADARELGHTLRDFPWWLLAPALALTLGNYGLRWLKWHVYLRAIGVRSVPVGTSALVFLAGFSMSVTPGKVGELIKGVYLRRLAGTPVARTGAVIAAERITDGLAMLALAGIGLTQFAYGRPLLAAAAVAALAVVLLLQRPHLFHSLLARLEARPLAGRAVTHAAGFLDASNALYRPRLLVGAVALGVVSWAGECLAFFLILTGLDLPASWHLLLVATFVLSASSIFGALSVLPGGLGVAEASITGMLLLLVDDPEMTRSTAVAATLLIRFATLWFAVILGALALATLERVVARGATGEQPRLDASNTVSEAT